MLVWINGAFGSGKTLVAHELQRRIRGAHVSDPELMGISLHKMLPPSARHDFQDLPQCRSGVLATLIQGEAACAGPLIVPMTIVRDNYFDELVGGLRSSGVDVRHYALTATRHTLHRRLQRRNPYLVGKCWAETRGGQPSRSSAASPPWLMTVTPPTFGLTTELPMRWWS